MDAGFLVASDVASHVASSNLLVPQWLRALLFIGPSGAGKDTLMNRIMSVHTNTFTRVPSYTTRPLGKEEKANGTNYVRLNQTDFDDMKREGKFAWDMEYDGNSYGTSQAHLDLCLDKHGSSRRLIADIDKQVVEDCFNKIPPNQRLAIYLWIEDLTQIEQRLRCRGRDSEAAIQGRLEICRGYNAWAQRTPGLTIVFNDGPNPDRAVEQILREMRRPTPRTS